MKKLFMSLMVVLLVFSFVSFAAAQKNDFSDRRAPGSHRDLTVVPGGLGNMLYIPHFDISSGWWSGLAVQNNAFAANQAIIWFFDNDGYWWDFKEVAMTGLQKEAWMLTTQMTDGLTSGFIFIESQLPIISFINYGTTDPNTGRYVAVTTLGPFFSY